MKILRVTSSGFQEGGAEHGIVHMNAILERYGHEVRVLASDAHSEKKHFNHYSYKAPRGFFGRFLYTFNVSAYISLKKALADFKPDIVHFHTLGAASPLVLFAARKYPTVATVHGPEGYTRDLILWNLPKSDFRNTEYDFKKLTLSGSLRYFYYRWINYPLYSLGLNNIDRFVTISTYIRDVMSAQGRDSVYIPNGIKLFSYSPLGSEPSHALVFSGRLEKFKGLEYVLRAMPQIIERFPDTILYVAGSGRDEDELKALTKTLRISHHVQFLGFIGHEELGDLYRKASISLVPSIWPEVCSRTGIESMSVGRPVIGTNVGGTPDWIMHGENGFLVEPKDEQGIADSVTLLFGDPEKMRTMGQKARKIAELYDIERHAEKIQVVYTSLLPKHIVQTQRESEVRVQNVYYITDSVWRATSAPIIHTDEICKNLHAQGINVRLYVPSVEGCRPDEVQYRLTAVPTGRTLLSLRYQIRLLFRLLRDMRKERPDVLYVRHSSLLFIPAVVSKLFATPLILEVNGKLSEEIRYETPLLSKCIYWSGLLWLLEIFNVRVAAKVIASKEGIKNYLVEAYAISEEKVEVITNAVDVQMFKPGSILESRKKLGLDETATYVGYIGSLYEWQGLRHVLGAAKYLQVQSKNIRFLIVGDGPEYKKLQNEIENMRLSDMVEIRPAVHHRDVPTYISSMDICLSYPDKFRSNATSPFKVYEYLSCGRAVIVSHICGFKEEFGSVVKYAEPESPEQLALSILELVVDKELRKSLGERGRRWIIDGKCWGVVAKKTVAICADAVTRAANQNSPQMHQKVYGEVPGSP